jgi:hypothetical protein
MMFDRKNGFGTIGADFASAGAVRGPYATPAETILAGCWSGAGFTCAGCGQPPPPDFDRVFAVSLVRDLPRRFATLLGQAEPPGPCSERGARSVLEPAYYASGLLAFAVSQVRRMSGLDDEIFSTTGTTIDAVATETIARGTAIVLSNLFDCSDRLTQTIEDMTDREWTLFVAVYGASAGQLVWLALHGAIHHLEDTELGLEIASAIASGSGA